MVDALAAVNDILILFFDLLIYTKLICLKRDTPLARTVMYGSCFAILIVYYVAAYVLKYPAVLASFLCMSLPSFVVFWILSKYKDARFFTTFCFVDTVSLVIAFFGRLPGIYGGVAGAAAGCLLTLVMLVCVYIVSRPHFSKYRELLDSVQSGWIPLMISTLLIYLLLVFSAAYPKPLIQRTEYFLIYGAICLTVLSFYVVFTTSLFQMKRLYELNEELASELQWHSIAYIDPLTGLKNRMAYVERINELARSAYDGKRLVAVMMDVDNFKSVNDTFGHHTGDEMLKQVASRITEIFQEENYEAFRIGGDEFAMIAAEVSAEELEDRLEQLNVPGDRSACCFSYGYALVDAQEKNPIENAFMRADSNMYRQKKGKKGAAAD